VSAWEPTLTLRDGVSLVEAPSGRLTLQTAWGEAPLDAMSPGTRAGLRVLANGGGTTDEIVSRAQAAEPGLQLAYLYFRLDRLAWRGFIAFGAAVDGRPLLRATAMMRGAKLAPVDLGDDAAVRLSRFAYCRRDGDGLVVESPLSGYRVALLAPEASAVVAALATARGPADTGVEIRAARACVALLRAAGLVGATDALGRLEEDASAPLVQTEFHDLLYHRRSRRGWTDQPVGATFSHVGAIEPLPAIRPPHPGAPIPLARADVEALASEDLPFTQVLESRASVRAYDEARPIDLPTLGAFLYRTARLRALVPAQEGAPYESSSRPYPSGGATYDLEIYLTVRACDGLAPGLYHYRPDEHALVLVTDAPKYVDALVEEAFVANARQARPQVLVTLTSRFARLSWKYSGMAYAATLKNVGVLYQTMYLVATAMGLAPCALGNGDSMLFAEATGIDPAVESSVGEFMLGSRPPG
jgi:SagB-type dehydrogenase family enzyme